MGAKRHPALGHFIQPDTLVPDPSHALDYHRYGYVRFNPLKYNDPSGHCVATAVDAVASVASGGGALVLAPSSVAFDAACWAAVVATIQLSADLADNPPAFPETSAPASNEAFPLALAEPQIYAQPVGSDQEIGITIPGISADSTLKIGNLIAEPLPVVNPTGHIYFADRANTTAEIVGREGTYTISFDSQGYPDFTPYAIAQVKVNMKGNYTSDFTEANKAAGYKKTPAGYTWHHHQDGETMQLVPTDLHKRVFHYGGVNALKKR